MKRSIESLAAQSCSGHLDDGRFRGLLLPLRILQMDALLVISPDLDRFEPRWICLANARRNCLDDGLVVGTEEERDGKSGLALNVVCTVYSRLEDPVGPHAQGIPDIYDKVAC